MQSRSFLDCLSLQSPQQPIGGWYFLILELLILPVAPLAVVLMVAVHAWTPPETKAYSLTALVFTGLPCRTHVQHPLRHSHREPSDRIRRSDTVNTVPVLQVALRRVRSRRSCLGRLLWAGHAVCRTCLQRRPAREIDSDSDVHQWRARSCRVKRSCCQGHAASHAWGNRLRGHFPRCGAAVGDLVYANSAALTAAPQTLGCHEMPNESLKPKCDLRQRPAGPHLFDSANFLALTRDKRRRAAKVRNVSSVGSHRQPGPPTILLSSFVSICQVGPQLTAPLVIHCKYGAAHGKAYENAREQLGPRDRSSDPRSPQNRSRHAARSQYRRKTADRITG